MLLDFGAELLDHSFALGKNYSSQFSSVHLREVHRRRVVLRSFQTWMQVDQCERAP